MTYSVNPKYLNKGFYIPSVIVDKHLRLASGEQIKVLLLILRKAPEMLDENEIAKKLKYTVSDVEDYLQYWVMMGVLDENNEPVQDEPVKYIPKSDTPAKKEEPKPEKNNEPQPVPSYSKPSVSEIATRITESKEIANLFNELQSKLGKTIGYDGQCTFLLLHDRYGLPTEVIFMLVDYCIQLGKTGYSYIETVGIRWSEQEIDTIDRAAEKIASIDVVEKFWKKFTAATGISNPKPTTAQRELIEKWLSRKMNFDMIILAYEQMSEATGKLSFSYMDKVLDGWYNEGYKTPSDVKNAKKAKADASKAAREKGKEASYDLDKYSEKSIHKKLKYEKRN